MTLSIFIVAAALLLAYANGANDNFKGVATLFGSRTTHYRGALYWATACTLLGAMMSILWAETLVKRFSGKGLVPDSLVGTPEFLLAVAIGAGITVMLATRLGFPISTTHSLIGALCGAGVVAVGPALNLSTLGTVFLLPLCFSPLAAMLLAFVVYLFCQFLRLNLKIDKETCLCIGEQEFRVSSVAVSGEELTATISRFEAAMDSEVRCVQRYSGRVFGVNCQKLLDSAHYGTAGLTCFARGLNDTPKIAALILAANAFSLSSGIYIIAVVMGLGGLLSARKVAERMSNDITAMDRGQGFAANLVTASLVITASRLGLPVSTTHVSVGSLFGIRMVSGKGRPGAIRAILLSWVLTLPIAAILAGAAYYFIKVT